jgi:hypothetical protein
MARTPKSDLADFHLYLKDVLGPASTSVSAYCSMVRRVIRSVPTLTEENLTNFFYTELNPTMRANIRAAWNHYVEFNRTVHAVAIPSPGYLKTPKTVVNPYQGAQPLPEEVVDVVFRLVNLRKWPLTVILNGTWNKVIARPASRLGDAALIFPFGKVTHWLAFERELAVLRQYAHPSGTPEGAAPLIPFEPGSLRVYPGLTLQHALKNLKVRPDHLEEADIPVLPTLEKVKSPSTPRPARTAEAEKDVIGRPVSTEELEAILRSQRMPAAEQRPGTDFFFMIDLRFPAEKKLPDGMRSRAEIEAARLRAPPRTSAAGWAIHRALDSELEALAAWEQGEGIIHSDPAKAEPFVFDLDED